MTARRPRLATLALAAAALPLLGPAPAQSSAPEGDRAPRTTLVLAVDDCKGCEVQLHQARRTLDADVVHVWSSAVREVRDGEVAFRIATRRTRGMTATVRAPWEGHTGYATTVAWRYGGTQVGDPVTLEEAVGKKRASACWKGTRQRRLVLPLVVEEVEVDGVQERVPGSIAFVATTQAWLPPMRRVRDGVLGSQDVDVCG